MTGRHAVRVGMTSTKPNFHVMGLGPGSLPEDELTLPELLRSRGYSTGMVGKWHLGGTADGRGLPTRHGFDSYWGMPITNVQACRAGHREYPHSSLLAFIVDRPPTNLVFGAMLVVALTPWLIASLWRWRVPALLLAAITVGLTLWFTATLTLLNPNACFLYANETLIEQPIEIGYLTLRHTEQAEHFLTYAPRPFFLYLAYANAHTALFAMDRNVGRSAHGMFGDNVEEMDDSIGHVLGFLEARGELNDTFVYFASDNGPFREELHEGGSCGYAPIIAGDTPLVTLPGQAPPPRAAARMRGAKGQTWDCGLRVPAALAYPTRWSGGSALHVATSSMDVLPTVLHLVDQATSLRHVSELKEGEQAGPGTLDGRSLVPLLDRIAATADIGIATRQPPAVAPDEVHDFIFHYCGGHVTAVRHGKWKLHYTTAKWEDEDAQICRRSIICSCQGFQHDPPLLFDIHADPAELLPINVSSPAFTNLLAKVAEAKGRQEASVRPIESQTEKLPLPHHFPCCGVERGTLAHAWSVFRNICGC